MNRILISFLFVLFSSGIFAQNSIDGFMELFTWVKKLDENISSIVRTENQKKLTRQLGYLQSDLDNFIEEKKDITNMLIQHCQDSSVTLIQIEKEIDDYNEEINILTNRVKDIRKAIIFKDDLYSVTEKHVVTLYRKPDSTDITTNQYVIINNDSVLINNETYLLNNPPPINAMVQQRAMDMQGLPQENLIPLKDSLMDITYTRNRNAWKEVDTENLFFEIEKSIAIKGSNMNYIFKELSKGCNLKLINEENEMAIQVLTNIRNEFRSLRKKIREYVPTK